MLRWLNVEPDEIQKTAQRLLHVADSNDPLREWIRLVRLFHPKKWEQLQGDALIAMDYRIAAEMLLRFYEDLVQEGIAPPLKKTSKHFREPLDGRLGRDRKSVV